MLGQLLEVLKYWEWKLGKTWEGRDRARMLVRIRDEFTCQRCGDIRTPLDAKEKKLRMFDVHHVGGGCGKGRDNKYDGVDDLWKMTTLCHRCHFLREDHTFQSYPQMNFV